MKMAVNDVQDQNLSNRIESLPPKLRNIKSHPYLNTYSTPPLPKPFPKHFHQLSDQTGQQTQKFHHNHQTSLPQQLSSQVKNPFQSTNQPYQIDKQPIYLNSNIDQYETTINYGDLDNKNESLYINQPIINRSKSDNSQLSSSDNSFNTGNDQMNGGQFSQNNGYLNGNQLNNHLNNQLNHQVNNQLNNQLNHQLNRQFNQLNQLKGHHLNGQINYQNHRVNSQFNHIENQQKVNSTFRENQCITQSTYHGLPVKFVKALKKLFDIFDTNKCGLVRIIDIESRINDEEFDEELDRPQDLIDSLRKVTSPNGLINFANFCAAINICLLKNQLNKSKKQEIFLTKPKNDRNDSYMRAQNLDKSVALNGHLNGHMNGNHKYSKYQQSSINSNSPLENSSFTSTNSASSSNSSSRLHKEIVKTNLRTNQNSQTLSKLKYRPSSVPVEFNGEEEEQTDYFKDKSCSINKKLDNKAKSMGNLLKEQTNRTLKEQIYANRLRLCSSESRIQQTSVVSPQKIMEKLFEWRNNLLERKLRSMNIGNNGLQPYNQPIPINPQLNHLYSIVQKKTVKPKRDEMRRHTVNIVQSNLQGLNSLNTAKKLMNMQKEKDLLQNGLIIIERAKQYYLRQIAIAQNQIDALNQYANGSNFFLNQLNNDYNIKQHLDKLNSLEQINRNLALLIDDQLPKFNYF